MGNNVSGDNSEDYISLGLVRGTHGLRGEFYFSVELDEPEYFFEKNLVFTRAKDGTYSSIELIIVGQKKDGLILKAPKVDSVEKAKRLVSSAFFVRRTDFPNSNDGKHFVMDLLGLNVISCELSDPKDIDVFNVRYYGSVKDIVDFGSGYMLEILLNKTHQKNVNKNVNIEYYYKNEETVRGINFDRKTISIVTQDADFLELDLSEKKD